MKRILLFSLMFGLLCTLLFSALPVSAEVDSTAHDTSCYITGYLEKIEFRGDIYLPLPEGTLTLNGLEEEDYISLTVAFSESNIEKQYAYVDVLRYENCSYALHVYYHTVTSRGSERVFVEENRYAELMEFVNGENDYGYATYSCYYNNSMFLSQTEIDTWAAEEVAVETDAKIYDTHYEKLDLDACYSDTCFRRRFGQILRRYNYETEQYDYLLVLYRDYEIPDFYADGTLAYDKIAVKAYPLTDTLLAERLTEFYETTRDDDLEWVVDTAVSDTIFFIVTLLLFGILPLAAIIAAMIFVIIKRPRNPYASALLVLCIAAAVVIIGYAVVLYLLI